MCMFVDVCTGVYTTSVVILQQLFTLSCLSLVLNWLMRIVWLTYISRYLPFPASPRLGSQTFATRPFWLGSRKSNSASFDYTASSYDWAFAQVALLPIHPHLTFLKVLSYSALYQRQLLEALSLIRVILKGLDYFHRVLLFHLWLIIANVLGTLCILPSLTSKVLLLRKVLLGNIPVFIMK